MMADREHTSGSETRDPHDVAAVLITADLVTETATLMREMTASGLQHTAKTLSKDGNLRVVLMCSLSGHRLREHAAHGSVMIHTVKGRIRTLAAGRTLELPAGSMVILEPDVRHDVEALEDSAFLLTIAQT